MLPGGVLNHCATADAEQVRVLLWLSSDLSLCDKPKQLSKLADCDQKTVKNAIRYWKSCGVLVEEGEEAAVPAMAEATAPVEQKEAGSKPLLHRADELPQYTTAELSELLEKRAGMRALVDEAQRLLGKMFNTMEINVLVGMVDYLGIGEEGILLLLAHCKKIGKTNLRSIEKYAYGFVDKGITEPGAMEEEFRALELMRSFEGEIRTLFGTGARALTAKESKMLRAWGSYGYGVDVVRRAYEITVNATGKASLAYADAILGRWNAEGLRDLAAIDAAIEQERGEKDGKVTLGSSFDTDDFFEAALQRSFRDPSAK